MKRKTAKEILAESFRELAAKTPVDRITIREITENCGYSPATFYRQFRDKYDLIAWAYTRDLEKIMDRLIMDRDSLRQTLFNAAVYYEKHREYLKNLFLHTSGYDSFVRNMTEINYNCFEKTVLQSAGLAEADEKLKMYIRIYVLGTVSLTCEWILDNYRAAAEEVAEIYENSLPEPLRPYFN